jgi:hypothetical protein
MKKLKAVLATGLVLSVGEIVLAGSTVTQTITYEVKAINELSVSAPPSSFIIDTANAGAEPDTLSKSTTYAITTNETKKITGKLNENMPPGVTLKIKLATPAGGSSPALPVTLTDGEVDLVTGVSKIAETGLVVTYTLSATSEAGTIALNSSKSVTLTIAASE